jgi:hypothetical protein
MKVSVTWLAITIIIGILYFFTVRGFNIYEEFKDDTQKNEGFANNESQLDLKITTCPADTKSYVDNGGRTVCCDGIVSNGKCSGPTVCSLSEGTSGVPTCSEWLDAYLEDKGASRCPPSMKRYYENKTKDARGNTIQTAGCTSGNRNATGTEPESKNNTFCTLYNSEAADMLKIDSCTNKKFFEETRCFSSPIDNLSKQFVSWGPFPPPITCSAMDKGSLVPLTCIDDSSFARTVDYYVKKYAPYFTNWKEQSIAWGPQWKLNFCSVVQKLNINKSMQFKDLESYKVF